MEAFNFCMEIESTELNSASSDQFSECFFKPNNSSNWDNSDPFDSTLSSIVSSPATATNSGAAEGLMIRELIGRLGNICSSGDSNSCHATPLNSPPKPSLLPMPNPPLSGNFLPAPPPGLAPFAGDPGFVERAAKNCLFGTGQFGLGETELGRKPDPAKTGHRGIRPGPERRGSQVAVADNDSREGSSVSDQIIVENDGNAKKRKSSQRAKAKEVPSPPKVKDVGANSKVTFCFQNSNFLCNVLSMMWPNCIGRGTETRQKITYNSFCCTITIQIAIQTIIFKK